MQLQRESEEVENQIGFELTPDEVKNFFLGEMPVVQLIAVKTLLPQIDKDEVDRIVVEPLVEVVNNMMVFEDDRKMAAIMEILIKKSPPI